MIGKVIGAIAGSQASKYTGKLGGTSGAVLGALAIPLARRLKLSSLLAIGAGGYLVKKLSEKGKAADTAGNRTSKVS